MPMAEGYQPPEGYLTMEGAAERLGVSLVTMRKAVREAGIETYRDNLNKRVRLVKQADVEKLRQPVPEGKAAA
jgi:excisionase family DNA binding protein